MTARREARFSSTDWGLLFVVLMLLIVGMVMVYSASYGFALMKGGEYEGNPSFFIKRQLVFGLAGLVAMLICWQIDYRLYRRFAVHILFLTVGILFLMAVVGRWLVQRRSIQPVELAKVGAMVYIAVWLEAKGDTIRHLTLGLIPFALLLGLIAGLIIVQPDFSTSVLLIATATAMFFVAGADVKQLLVGFLFGGMALVAVAFVAQYRSARIRLFLEGPFSDVRGQGFQVVQTLVALNKGGWFGVGLGQSGQKFAIFAPHTDAAFAIIAEEMGFIGALFVIGLYVLWTWRGFRIARYAPDTYGMLLAIGLVAWVTFQAALHVAVVTASTPFTGTVLPFVSYGGSSLMSSLAAVGILLNISRASHEPPNQREET
jgi:cell division protein FtsW